MAPFSFHFATFVTVATSALALQSIEKATFTHYGSADYPGSKNCANPPADSPLACGPDSAAVAGYTAAASNPPFGVGDGQGAGSGCGTCWELTILTDQDNNPVTQRTITVTVNNLCPADSNQEWCQVPNQFGGQAHFDLCSDNGSSEAFFTSTGSGIGTAQQVPCGAPYSNATSPANKRH